MLLLTNATSKSYVYREFPYNLTCLRTLDVMLTASVVLAVTLRCTLRAFFVEMVLSRACEEAGQTVTLLCSLVCIFRFGS